MPKAAFKNRRAAVGHEGPYASSKQALEYDRHLRDQPRLVVEDAEDGSPLECLCGSTVLCAWEVQHESPSRETCSVRSCDKCWATWLQNTLHRHTDLWNANCICNRAKISLASLQVVLRSNDFRKLCDNAAAATARRLRNWISCPNGACTYGHEHSISDDGIKWYCQNSECGMIACASCRSPWHEGQTCSEYSKHVLRDEFRSFTIKEQGRALDTIQECPKCHQALYKTEGCDHMTCVCGHEFCYLCRRQFLKESSVPSILLVRHRSSCCYRNQKLQGFSIYGVAESELFEDSWELEFVDTSAAVSISFQFIEGAGGPSSNRVLVHKGYL